MRRKWCFRNETTQFINESDRLKTELTWNPVKGYPALELFVGNVKQYLFSLLPDKAERLNLNI